MTRPWTVWRRDQIKAVLREATHPLTTLEIVKLLGNGRRFDYTTVYADLRALNRAGEVVWHPYWKPGEPNAAATTWTLAGGPDVVPDDGLEALWNAPTAQEENGGRPGA